MVAFIPAKQSSFFEERFQIHRALDGFIQRQSRRIKTILMYERVHLYYDFMFCLLNDRSFAQLKTIHVFVDFSGGEDYNRFIAKLLLLSIIWMS